MKKEYRLTEEQKKLSPEELAKDVKLQIAAGLLKELDDSIDVQWVKEGDIPKERRVIQVVG